MLRTCVAMCLDMVHNVGGHTGMSTELRQTRKEKLHSRFYSFTSFLFYRLRNASFRSASLVNNATVISIVPYFPYVILYTFNVIFIEYSKYSKYSLLNTCGCPCDAKIRQTVKVG